MNLPPDSTRILEGSTSLVVPQTFSKGGPGKRVGRVFFNDQMAFNRDVSVMFLRARRPRSALDGMASTGARAVRWGREVAGIDITANDRDPEAVEYIEANIALNAVAAECRSSHDDIRCLLARRVFDYIDIDPFGTPVPFIPMAVQGAKRRGVVAITATDTAPLAGTYPHKCLRRYGARSARSPYGHESGLRILIGHIMREAAKEEKGGACLLSFYADHYFRTYIQFIEGGGEADKTLANLGYLEHDRSTGRTTVGSQPSPRAVGPLWLGPLHDPEVLETMSADDSLARPARCSKYLELWRQEVDVPYFYENDEISSILGISPPRLNAVLERMAEVGHASRTHFSPTGIKTDLPYDEVLSVYRDVARVG